jgi:hypothetical protein
VDPRTFLPPPRLSTAPAPRPGASAPGLPGGAPNRAAIVAFLRHVGCPFAEETMRRLRNAAVDHPEIEWLAVSHAGATDTQHWCDAIGGCWGVRVVSEPSRRIYAEWGLGRTSLAHFLGRRSLIAVAGLARGGTRNRHPVGTRWQSAGTFAVDAGGVVRWRHVPSHAGDLPDLEAAVRALGTVRGTGSPER